VTARLGASSFSRFPKGHGRDRNASDSRTGHQWADYRHDHRHDEQTDLSAFGDAAASWQPSGLPTPMSLSEGSIKFHGLSGKPFRNYALGASITR